MKIYKVQHHIIHDKIEALGTAFSNEVVDITSATTAKIKEIKFTDGQAVKKGNVLAILEQNEELAQKYAELAQWRDILLEKAKENPKLIGLDHNYKETKPQLSLTISKDRAGDFGVSIISINRTLESLPGSRQVTTFIDQGEEYDLIIKGENRLQGTTLDIQNVYVRSTTTQNLIPLSNLISFNEFADAATLNRYNRLRSITIDGSLADGYSLGAALKYLENLVRTELPAGVTINYKGESLDYMESGTSIYWIFLLSLVVVFLVMAGLFESFVHPFVIMLTVPLTVFGALIGYG